MGAPAQVEVGADVAEGGLPAAQGDDEVALDEGAGEGDRERVGHPVVLPLVGLAGHRPGEEAAAPRAADLERAQDVGVGRVDVLGADDAGRGRATPGVDEADEGADLGGRADGEQPRQRGRGAVELVVEQGPVYRGAHGGARVDGPDDDGHARGGAGVADDAVEVDGSRRGHGIRLAACGAKQVGCRPARVTWGAVVAGQRRTGRAVEDEDGVGEEGLAQHGGEQVGEALRVAAADDHRGHRGVGPVRVGRG